MIKDYKLLYNETFYAIHDKKFLKFVSVEL